LASRDLWVQDSSAEGRLAEGACMAQEPPSRWFRRLGMASAAATILIAVLMTSAMPAILDLRPALLVASMATALLLAVAGWRASRRASRVVVIVLAIGSGVASLWTVKDLWVVYRTEDIRFEGANGVQLSGTLYAPRRGRRHAAVALIHGAGPETRHEYRFEARRFARAGLVAIAYDKRGSGTSGGDFMSATYEQFAGDAVGAVNLLRSRADVDPGRVGLWGVSEGEWVGTMAAVACKPAFLVLVSPSAMTPSDQVRYETRANVLRAGFGEAAADRAAGLYARISAFERTGAGREDLNRELAAAQSEAWFKSAKYLDTSVPEYAQELAFDWFPAWRARMDFDSRPLLARVNCRVLAQDGGSDPKNDGQAALDRLREAIARGGNSRFTGLLYASAGHNIIVWPLPGHLPPPWFARGYLNDQLAWVLRATSQ